MKDGPIYVYDVRSQFMEPVFIVYNTDHVDVFVKALGLDDANLLASKERLHPYEGNRYKNTGSGGFCPPPKVKVNTR